MSSRKDRVSAAQFARVIKRAFSSEYFFIKTKENGLGRNRFAVVIGRAAEKSSVRRNLWKRRIVEQCRLLPALGQDFLFVASPGIHHATSATMRRVFDKAAVLIGQRPRI